MNNDELNELAKEHNRKFKRDEIIITCLSFGWIILLFFI